MEDERRDEGSVESWNDGVEGMKAEGTEGGGWWRKEEGIGWSSSKSLKDSAPPDPTPPCPNPVPTPCHLPPCCHPSPPLLLAGGGREWVVVVLVGVVSTPPTTLRVATACLPYHQDHGCPSCIPQHLVLPSLLFLINFLSFLFLLALSFSPLSPLFCYHPPPFLLFLLHSFFILGNNIPFFFFLLYNLATSCLRPLYSFNFFPSFLMSCFVFFFPSSPKVPESCPVQTAKQSHTVLLFLQLRLTTMMTDLHLFLLLSKVSLCQRSIANAGKFNP